MPRKPSENTTQIALRIPDAWLEKCDELIPWLSRHGIGVTRTEVLRAAIARGLAVLEEDRAHDGKVQQVMERARRGEKLTLADAGVLEPKKKR